jgi:hypothetical protein
MAIAFREAAADRWQLGVVTSRWTTAPLASGSTPPTRN